MIVLIGQANRYLEIFFRVPRPWGIGCLELFECPSPSLASLFLPQHLTELSLRTAQVKSLPSEMALAVFPEPRVTLSGLV